MNDSADTGISAETSELRNYQPQSIRVDGMDKIIRLLTDIRESLREQRQQLDALAKALQASNRRGR